MAQKPTSKPQWTVGNPDIATVSIEPGGPKKVTGWLAGEKPPFQWMNWLFYNISLWISYLEHPEVEPLVVDDNVTLSATGPRLILVDATDGSLDINLPLASLVKGMTFEFIRIDDVPTNSVTLNVAGDGGGDDDIEGELNILLPYEFDKMELTSNGDRTWYKKLYPERLPITSTNFGSSFLNNYPSGATVLINPEFGPFTLFLPMPRPGLKFTFKDVSGILSTANVTIERFGTEKIETVAADFVLDVDFGSWNLVSDGTDWFFV